MSTLSRPALSKPALSKKALSSRLVRALKVGVAVGVAIGVARAIRGAKPPEPSGQASWTPLAEQPPPPKRSGPVQFAASVTEPTPPGRDGWVEPVDGECPASHPIKGNAQSGIFHVPGGLSYERTVPERCYATEADAEADGFRRAKR